MAKSNHCGTDDDDDDDYDNDYDGGVDHGIMTIISILLR